MAGAAPLPVWVQPGIAEPPADGAEGGAVDGAVDDDPPDDDPPDDDPPDEEPLDDEPLDDEGAVVAEPLEPLGPGGAVVELLLVAAVAVPAVNSVAPTAPPARSEPTMPAAATAVRVRFMLSPSIRVQPRWGALVSIRPEPQAAVGRAWELAGSFRAFLRAASA